MFKVTAESNEGHASRADLTLNQFPLYLKTMKIYNPSDIVLENIWAMGFSMEQYMLNDQGDHQLGSVLLHIR